MTDIPRTVSLSSSDLDWKIVDNRAKNLGFDRSKYTQKLYELDLKYNILSNNQLLHVIKTSGKRHLGLYETIVLLFLFAIVASILTLTWLLL